MEIARWNTPCVDRREVVNFGFSHNKCGVACVLAIGDNIVGDLCEHGAVEMVQMCVQGVGVNWPG